MVVGIRMYHTILLFLCVHHAFLDHLRVPGQPLPTRGSPPARHVPSSKHPVVTLRPHHLALRATVPPVPLRTSFLAAAHLFSASLAWPRCTPRARWRLAASSLVARSIPCGARRRSAAWRPWRERRATPRGSRSPLANAATRARARATCGLLASDENFLNFFSQLLPRHALQVSIDKERASPPRPLKRKPITAIREAAAPASASPARYNPG